MFYVFLWLSPNNMCDMLNVYWRHIVFDFLTQTCDMWNIYWINMVFLWFSPKTCVTCWTYIEELLIVFDFLTNTCDMLKMYWKNIDFLWFSLAFSKQHVWHVERILKTYCFWFSYTNMWHVEHILKKYGFSLIFSKNMCDMLNVYWRTIDCLWFSYKHMWHVEDVLKTNWFSMIYLIFSKQHVWHVEHKKLIYCRWVDIFTSSKSSAPRMFSVSSNEGLYDVHLVIDSSSRRTAFQPFSNLQDLDEFLVKWYKNDQKYIKSQHHCLLRNIFFFWFLQCVFFFFTDILQPFYQFQPKTTTFLSPSLPPRGLQVEESSDAHGGFLRERPGQFGQVGIHQLLCAPNVCKAVEKPLTFFVGSEARWGAT